MSIRESLVPPLVPPCLLCSFLPSFSFPPTAFHSVSQSIQISLYLRALSLLTKRKQGRHVPPNDQFYLMSQLSYMGQSFKIPTELTLSLPVRWRLFSQVFFFFSLNPCPLTSAERIFFHFCNLHLWVIRDTNGNFTSKLLVLGGKKRLIFFHRVSWSLYIWNSLFGFVPCEKWCFRNMKTGYPGGSVVKNPPANTGDVDWEDPLEEETATHSSILT